VDLLDDRVPRWVLAAMTLSRSLVEERVDRHNSNSDAWSGFAGRSKSGMRRTTSRPRTCSPRLRLHPHGNRHLRPCPTRSADRRGARRTPSPPSAAPARSHREDAAAERWPARRRPAAWRRGARRTSPCAAAARRPPARLRGAERGQAHVQPPTGSADVAGVLGRDWF